MNCPVCNSPLIYEEFNGGYDYHCNKCCYTPSEYILICRFKLVENSLIQKYSGKVFPIKIKDPKKIGGYAVVQT